MQVFPKVYLGQEINKFRKFFNDENLTISELHAIMKYAGIAPIGHDSKGNEIYNAVRLKNTRAGTESANGLRNAYKKLRELQSIEIEKEPKPKPITKSKRPKPVQLKLDLQENVKRIIITEAQFKELNSRLSENINGKYYIDPEKVLIVKNYLDKNFVKASIPCMGSDGYPTSMPIVGLKGTDGTVMKNMTDKQLFFMLQNHFFKMFSDANERDKFLKQIIKDWYYGKISKEGMPSVNMF